MDCPKCGHKNKTGATACSSCYFELDSNKKPVNAPAQKPASPRKASPLPTQAQPASPQAPQPQYAAQTQVQAPPQPGTAPSGPGYPPPGGPGGQPPSGPAPFQGPGAFSSIPLFNYVGIWPRFVAVFLDAMLYILLAFLIAVMTGAGAEAPPASLFLPRRLSWFLSVWDSMGSSLGILDLIYVVYVVAMIGTTGATLGRMALGIKVVREDGSALGIGLSLARYLVEAALGILTCSLHYLAIEFSPTKQGWHDKLLKTVVIRSR